MRPAALGISAVQPAKVHMQGVIRRLRGMVGMGLSWALGWALFGIGVGVTSVLVPWLPWGAVFRVFDAPLPALALPGFVGGLLFSVVLSAAARRRTFAELSVRQFALWGALGGVLLSLVPATLAGLGLATLTPGSIGLWGLTAVIGVPFTLLSAGSAAGSLVLAQRADAQMRLRQGPAAAAPNLPLHSSSDP